MVGFEPIVVILWPSSWSLSLSFSLVREGGGGGSGPGLLLSIDTHGVSRAHKHIHFLLDNPVPTPPHPPLSLYEWHGPMGQDDDLIRQSAEALLHLLGQVIVPGPKGLLAIEGVLELHGGQLVHDIAHTVADLGPGHFPIGGLDGLEGVLVEAHHVPEDPGGLVEGTVAIVVGVTILLKEVILDETGNLKGDLVSLIETALTDELDNLGQILLRLEDLSALGTKGDKLGLDLFVMGVQGLLILGVGEGPVNRGEMLPLSELLIQTPEDLDNTKSRGGHGIGEITTGG